MTERYNLRNCKVDKKPEPQTKPQNENSSSVCTTERLSPDTQRRLFGFAFRELTSCSSFQKLLCRPTDPACLGILRFMFGLLMVVDIPQERGMSVADVRWGDQYLCHFPLFDFLKPLPLQWMYMVYLVMLLGAIGIMLGLLYRLSCVMFVVSYWYIFLLDKTVWNNHSYLYGLTGFLLLMCDANRYWSLDGILNPKIRNAHVPLWNYTLLRSQIFLVYFIAGLKKLDRDWVAGYSMQNLSNSWVFDPFRLFLTNEQIDLFVVHHMGLILDLSIGFLLFFDKTRPIAFFFGSSFHLMNSQLFSIGMFPYTMLATMPLFCYPDWPRCVFRWFPGFLSFFKPQDGELQTNSHCIYNKEDVKSESNKDDDKLKKQIPLPQAAPTKAGFHHRLFSCVTVLYIATQAFLPYSHSVTKGYNTWTNGLYGYSWDMMVHVWSTQHIRITYRHLDSGEEGYLDPKAWIHNSNSRWSSHADMVKQYSSCIADRLMEYNLTNIGLYFDVWRSLNDRFQQRVYDPNMDILRTPWSQFTEAPYNLPLLVDLSSWREKLEEIQKDLYDKSNFTDVIFVADFPGLHLENFIQPELNTSISLLKGQVIVEIEHKGENYTLKEGDQIQVPSGDFHKVYTVSDEPSCYMYIYVNRSKEHFVKRLDQYKEALDAHANGTDTTGKLKKVFESDPKINQYKEHLAGEESRNASKKRTMWKTFEVFLQRKLRIFIRSLTFTQAALKDIVWGESFEEFRQSVYREEKLQKEKESLTTQETIKGP